MVRHDPRVAGACEMWLWPVFVAFPAPRPCVAEPKRWEQVQRRDVRTAIRDCDANQDVVWRCFGVLREHIEIAIVVEHTRVDELELRIELSAATIFLDQPRVWKLALRVLVQRL